MSIVEFDYLSGNSGATVIKNTVNQTLLILTFVITEKQSPQSAARHKEHKENTGVEGGRA